MSRKCIEKCVQNVSHYFPDLSVFINIRVYKGFGGYGDWALVKTQENI